MKIISPAYVAAVLLFAALSNATPQIYFPPDNPPQVTNYGRCITPNGERASCVVLDQCPFLYKMLEKKPLTDEDRQFLSRSQCGYNNDKVLICCPTRYIGTQSSPISTDTKTQGLLPQPGTCGNVISNRIYGGNITKIDEYPWMALIEYRKDNEVLGHHCGGSLINERYVLTAAHCISAIPDQWVPFRVRLGEWDTSTDRDCEKDVRGNEDCSDPHLDIEIEKVTTHESYEPASKSQLNDIALIRLSSQVTYTDFIRPICLPIKESLKRASFDGIVMDVAGWGKTEKGSSSNVKLKAGVSGVPLSECQTVYNQRAVELDNSQICAGGQMGIDSCRGDSGGPLIGLDTSSKVRVYYFLAGIVSFGPTPCGLQGWPGVYTKVSDFIGWIQQNIQA